VPELTIASFNVHWGRGSRRDDFPPFDVVAACSTFEADVIVLQETWGADGGVAQQEEVAEALGMRCLSVPMARVAMDPRPRVVGRPQAGDAKGDGQGDGESSLALLSRKPIRSSRTVALPHLPLDPWSRALLHAEIDVDGTNLTVVATHFTHLEHGAPLHTGALRRGLPPSDRPAALIGDLNMWGWTIDAMAPRGWRRALRGKTWPAPRPHHQIDHLLVTPSVEVIRGEVLGDMGSDHRPIRARLRVT
jgi:endonuclease/exonuclease/phosphatase family metal-dependent hydrolase